MPGTWLHRGGLKRETESLIGDQNNIIRTNYVKARISKTIRELQMLTWWRETARYRESQNERDIERERE